MCIRDRFYSFISNMGDASTGGNFKNFLQLKRISNGQWTDLYGFGMTTRAAGGTATATSPAVNFSTPGATHSVRACADKSFPAHTGMILSLIHISEPTRPY